MENASKALLIAGGVLLAMLTVALLIFAWGKFSEFYSNQDALADLEDATKFNLQFTGYDRDNIRGYELISLANKIADYNFRHSNAEGSKNDEKYTPITMEIYLKGLAKEFAYGEESLLFFSYNSDSNPMRQSAVENDIKNIIDYAIATEEVYGDTQTTTKLAKSINSLILTQEQLDYNKNYRDMSYIRSKQGALDDYNVLVPTDQQIKNYKTDPQQVESDYARMVTQITGTRSILKYYEYYKFKTGIFKCRSPIEYDPTSSRVSKIVFDFTGSVD